MSELDSRYVHRGFWINHDHGAIMGRTITTDTQSGNIVIVFLTLLSTVAATNLWSVIIFLYHHFRCTDRESNALFRQEQVYLRTQPSPMALLANHTKLWWAWRRRGSRKSPLLQLLPQILLAIFFAMMGMASSIFSSYVITSDRIEVLVSSPYCGTLQSRPAITSVWNEYIIAATKVMQIITDNCYLSDPEGAECFRLISPRINFDTIETECPFGSEICKPQVPAVQLDSGLQDVNPAFGFNLPPHEHVMFRKSTTCAVLSHENRTRMINADQATDTMKASLRPVDQELMLFDYGPSLSFEENTTFLYSFVQGNVSRFPEAAGEEFFSVPEMYEWSSFNTTKELSRPDADIFLRNIKMNSAYSRTQIHDPIFSFQTKLSDKRTDTGTTITIYGPDFPVGTIGCALQYQFCHKQKGVSEPVCSELRGLPGTVDSIGLPNATDVQKSAMKAILVGSIAMDMSNFDSVRAFSNAENVLGRFNLPDDQWVKELQAWESAVWAAQQIAVSDYAIGPQVRIRNLTSSYGIDLANTTAQEALCKMQRMRKSDGFVNINVFGLAFVITFAFVIMVIDFVLLRFLIYLGRFRKALSPRIDQWIQDGIYQLQRRAYEAADEGTWYRLGKEIPVTEGGDTFNILVDEPRHMRRRLSQLSPKDSMPLTLVASIDQDDHAIEKKISSPVEETELTDDDDQSTKREERHTR